MSKQEKLNRLRAALEHREGDRIPVSDFFWTGFVKKARALWGEDVDLYRKFDLDYVVVDPNMDPVIRDFEILEDDGENIRVRTGFGAVIRRSKDFPMPHFDSFSVREPEEMADFVIESGLDPRRLYRSGDDQINGVGDALRRNTPSWNERVDAYCRDFPVFGSICEGYEYLWRCIGTENALYWMLLEPELFGAMVERIGTFLLELLEQQIQESRSRLSGFYIWGDVAYVNGMLFSPAVWRKYFKPIVKKAIERCHQEGLLVIYHGCGNATAIYEDLIEMGLDGYNPVEAKAGLDVAALKEPYGNRLAFAGNMDVRVLESGDRRAIKRMLLRKLEAARGGGWICQSDHSVSSGVNPEDYAYMVELARDYGRYPLDWERIRRELEELQ